MTGKEVHTQKIDFLRLFGKKVVLNVSRWAWRMRKRVIYRKKPIFLKLAHMLKIAGIAIRSMLFQISFPLDKPLMDRNGMFFTFL